MSIVKLTSSPTNYDFTKKYVNTENQKGSMNTLDLYSYTGRVKFFDQEKGFGYIQEIPDTKNLKNVVKEWRITAEQLGNTVIHRGDFIYFMKHGKTIGEISPINLRDLLKTPCPECGRRDYIPGKDSCCPNCGHVFKKMTEEKDTKEFKKFNAEKDKKQDRDNDPAYNCLVGTNDDKPCPHCGRRAWKKYGYYQQVRCRCCGTEYKRPRKKDCVYEIDWDGAKERDSGWWKMFFPH